MLLSIFQSLRLLGEFNYSDIHSLTQTSKRFSYTTL